jgi:transposase
MSHPFFVHSLTEAEHTALLQGEAQAPHLAERNRFRTVLLSAKGLTPQQIRALLDLGRSTVWRALHTFERAGAPGLRERPRSGRPCKVPP